MKKLLSVLFVGLTSTFLPLLPASADTVTHFGDGVGIDDIPDLLDDVGIGRNNEESETTATTFTVPGLPSTTSDLTFEFERDTGTFLFSFGFFEVDSSLLAIDPIANKQAWATEALNDAILVFDDINDDPGTTSPPFTVSAGTNLGFFLIPNNTLEFFNANPGLFYPPSTSPDQLRAPLFSVSDANPGQFDQMLSFIDNEVTLFTFEDLSRVPGGFSDEDFTDLAFTIDTELLTPGMPPQTPEPSSTLSLLIVSILSGGVYIKRKRLS